MTYKLPLENIVESYVKIHNRKLLTPNFVNKVIALIDQRLNSPCCNNSFATIDLYTTQDNFLTRAVSNLLKDSIKKGNVKSLERTKKLLQKAIGIPCCA